MREAAVSYYATSSLATRPAWAPKSQGAYRVHSRLLLRAQRMVRPQNSSSGRQEVASSYSNGWGLYQPRRQQLTNPTSRLSISPVRSPHVEKHQHGELYPVGPLRVVPQEAGQWGTHPQSDFIDILAVAPSNISPHHDLPSNRVYLQQSQVVGKEVISRDTGRMLGVVCSLWVYTQHAQVVALKLERKAKSGSRIPSVSIIPLDCLTQIGDVILVDDDSSIQQKPLHELHGHADPTGIEVRTWSGQYMGKVCDCSFCPYTGSMSRIAYDEYGRTFLPRTLVESYSVPLSNVLSFNPRHITISEESRYMERRESAGMLGLIPSLFSALTGTGNTPSMPANLSLASGSGRVAAAAQQLPVNAGMDPLPTSYQPPNPPHKYMNPYSMQQPSQPPSQRFCPDTVGFEVRMGPHVAQYNNMVQYNNNMVNSSQPWQARAQAPEQQQQQEPLHVVDPEVLEHTDVRPVDGPHVIVMPEVSAAPGTVSHPRSDPHDMQHPPPAQQHRDINMAAPCTSNRAVRRAAHHARHMDNGLNVGPHSQAPAQAAQAGLDQARAPPLWGAQDGYYG